MSSSTAQRLISLLPGTTEWVCALGLQSSLVGISHECDFPAGISPLPRVSGTLIQHESPSLTIDAQVRAALAAGESLYQLDLAQIQRLAPTLLISQSLCAVCGVDSDTVEAALCELPGGTGQFNFAPLNLTSLFQAVRELGARLGVEDRASALCLLLEARIDSVRQRTATLGELRPRVAFLEWVDPLFSGGHWNPELVSLAGGIPVLGAAGEKSRSLEWAALAATDPDVIFIACCGFSVARTLAELPSITSKPHWQSLRAVQAGRVFVSDGNAFFNRSGPRLVDSLEQLAHALHPQVHPLPSGVPAAHALPAG